jgi:signal transduction histidine kinase
VGPPGDQERDEAQERQAFVRHELRTPLAVMRPVLDMLLEGTAGELGEKPLGYVRMLDRNLERLAAMIASVVDTGWLEAAAVPATAGPVPVAELLEAVAADVRASADGAPRIETDAPGDLPPVWGDPASLRRALRNVVVNACAFTPPAGLVTLDARAGAPRAAVVIGVADSGCGIPADELDSVCEFGYQGEAGRAREARGLGLGLYVARRVAEAHGGRLVVASAPGEGTRVTLELPAVAS